ncbi:putative ribonuclease H-like domain-containing protein [Tanacetum coccineum]|uniref:Ribonuclease H-like domain-containing protein n=1 Tax=Tanacetum coccineum TaxID=301880 RepID=A0ABQ5HBA7_9ASTR
MAGSEDDIPPPPPPPQTQTPTQQAPHTVSTIKLHILKKGEYDIWAMKMEHYLAHTDYPIWEFIQRGNGLVSVSTDTNGVVKVLPPKTAEEILARERERKARTTLLMALPEDHLAKFHKMTDAKEMWDAIKSRFGGNDESKKMQKYILKQQFEGFSVSKSEGLHKGYDRFQSLLSQLEIHGAGVSTEDANQKFLRSLPSSWSQVSLVMRTRPGVDSLSFDDLYNNLRVFESDVKGSTRSSSRRRLHFDAKEPVGFNKSKLECYNCHKKGHFAKECRSKGNQESRRRDAWNSGYKAKDNGTRPGKQEETKALVTLDGDGVDWTSHSEDEEDNHAFMAYSSSGSYTEVTSCSKECKESYAKLKKLYDEQREQLGDASIEIKAYTQALKKAEAQLVAHQQSQLCQMSARDKAGLGYGNQIHEGVLSYENEVFGSVFESRSSDIENSPVNDRYAEGMHVVPPPMTGIYIPSGPDVEIDDVETNESVPKPVANEPKAVSNPKVWSDAPIIEEYESDSDDEHSPKPNKKDWNGLMSKKLGLGYGFTEKACFVCGSFSHLIRDCDFHEKIMAKQIELNKQRGKGTGQRENRPAWNNVQRVNHQNKFVPTAVLTRTGKIPINIARASSTNNVNTARHNFNSQAVPTFVARKVNTVRPIVNDVRPKTIFHKIHSPIRRPFNRTTAPRTNFANQKINTAVNKAVSAIGGIGKTVVKPSADCIWRPKRNCDDPQKALKNKGIVDSGCSRHMTGNKAYLVDYQDYNGGPVAFGGSKGYITGKGKIRTGKLDFEDVCFVKELQLFNLFSVSQMCDKKNKVLFTDTECLVLSPDFKLPDENQVLLRVPRQNNMYSFNLENIVPSGGLACLIAKATVDESNKWHRRLGHVNFKNLNKLVKGNLVRGLPSKIFQNDHTCVACQKGKQHKASSEALTREFAQDTKDLHLQACPARATSTNTVNTASTPKILADEAFQDESWVNAMQEELLQFKIQKSCACSRRLSNLGSVKQQTIVATSTTVAEYRCYATIVGQYFTMEIMFGLGKKMLLGLVLEAINGVYRLKILDPSFYNTLFLNPKSPKKVYKVVKALYGLHQAPRAWYATLSTFLLKNRYRRGTIDKTLFIKKDKKDIMLVQVYVDDIIFGSTKKSWCDEFEALMKSRFQMSSMGELTFFLGLQVKQKEDGIFISQDKYIAEILKKFDFMNVKTASTPIETQKSLTSDEEATDVDVHLYRSMISSLMYLTASRPDIMFAVCACSRFQVTPKTSHLHVVKRIFRYLKGKPKLGLWYPIVSSFDLEAYSDSDYAGANLDRKSITEGCQFLCRRLISWQCKKQIIVATSTTEAEYVVAANCCGQVLWIQNQMLDYGFNFMNTKIYIDNESTICIVKNPVSHSKTKHIKIRHHFIRDAYEKKLIQVLKIHTDDNVADLLTNGFDVSRRNFEKKEFVSKQGRKKSIPELTLDDNTIFDDQDADHGMEYMETEEAVDEGRQSGKTEEVKLTDDTEVIEDKSSDIDAARQETYLMMELRLTAKSEGEAVFDLLRFIQKQIDEFGGQDGNIKNWLVQKQTTFGKDFSNPFTANSLLKTICAPCYSNEALAIPEQTATGKEISNPFMAGSLPKTT